MTVNTKDALDRLDNDAEIYGDLLDAFLEVGELDVHTMETAQIERDGKQVLYFAHKLKGAALTIGADDISRNAGAIEAALRAEITADVTANVASLLALYRNSTAEIRKIRDGLRTRS